MYLYPQYSKKLTNLFYINSFKILHKACLGIKKKNFDMENNGIKFNEIIIGLTSLFRRQINQTIILDKELFSIVLRTLSIMLNIIITEDLSLNLNLIFFF